ncbi:hypothetical protein GCM10009808_03490 [Microbacterium sediminicola]|uniref:DUF2993 domain-containing protein n=1 Tax=Microbacterium sediminicola TaxID=415210 RepID=A0ABP4TLU6_9MICO
MLSNDEHPTDPIPDARYQWVLADPSGKATKPKRRVWPWLVGGAAALFVLIGVAIVVVEVGVKSAVEASIADQVRTELELPADHPVDVAIPGPFLPQLLTSTLDALTISSEDVPLGAATADVTVAVEQVSMVAPHTMAGGEAVVSLDQTQVTALMDGVAAIDILELALDEPVISVGTELSLFGIGIPISLGLVPSADEGELLLTPDTLQVSGLTVSAAQVRSQFGAIADPILQDWRICVAQFLPAGATLTAASVAGEELVATFAIDGGILSDSTLQQNGTCD